MNELGKVIDLDKERRLRRPDTGTIYLSGPETSETEEIILEGLRSLPDELIDSAIQSLKKESKSSFTNREILRKALFLQGKESIRDSENKDGTTTDELAAIAEAVGVYSTFDFDVKDDASSGLTPDELRIFEEATRDEISAAQLEAARLSGNNSFTLKTLVHILSRNRQ